MRTSVGTGKRILVVEDEPTVSQFCQIVLAYEGFTVDVASDGKIAQNLVGEREYDLCLIDIRMPAMNGMELFQWLKVRFPHIADRVIFTTGDVISGNATTFLEKAAGPLLVKPFTIDELKTMMKDALKQRAN